MNIVKKYILQYNNNIGRNVLSIQYEDDSYVEIAVSDDIVLHILKLQGFK